MHTEAEMMFWRLEILKSYEEALDANLDYCWGETWSFVGIMRRMRGFNDRIRENAPDAKYSSPCPYEYGSAAAADWRHGWEVAGDAAEAAEEEAEGEAAISRYEDCRY